MFGRLMERGQPGRSGVEDPTAKPLAGVFIGSMLRPGWARSVGFRWHSSGPSAIPPTSLFLLRANTPQVFIRTNENLAI
jgi:hypothetical protein